MSVSWLTAPLLKRKSDQALVLAMWHLSLTVQSRSAKDTQALAACLATDCATEWLDENRFSITLDEAQCKDLRAMWNTRLRGLIATDSVLQVFGKHS